MPPLWAALLQMRRPETAATACRPQGRLYVFLPPARAPAWPGLVPMFWIGTAMAQNLAETGRSRDIIT